MAFHSVSTSRRGPAGPARPGRRPATCGFFDLGRACQRGADGADRYGAPLPIAPGRDPVPVGRRRDERRGQDPLQLLERERGMGAFDAPGVCVEGREQRALGGRQVAEDEVQRLGHHAQVVGAAAVLPGVDVGPGQLGLVGQHLLEVGYQPTGIGRVAQKPPTMWSYMPPAAMASSVRSPMWRAWAASERPRRACRRHSSTRLGRGNFGAGPKPPHSGSNPAATPATTCSIDPRHRAHSRPARRRAAAGAAPPRPPPSDSSLSASASLSSRCTAPTSASACSRTWARSLVQASPNACTTTERRHAVALDRWEVGPGIEGAPVRSAEDGHGPASRSGQAWVAAM